MNKTTVLHGQGQRAKTALPRHSAKRKAVVPKIAKPLELQPAGSPIGSTGEKALEKHGAQDILKIPPRPALAQEEWEAKMRRLQELVGTAFEHVDVDEYIASLRG